MVICRPCLHLCLCLHLCSCLYFLLVFVSVLARSFCVRATLVCASSFMYLPSNCVLLCLCSFPSLFSAVTHYQINEPDYKTLKVINYCLFCWFTFIDKIICLFLHNRIHSFCVRGPVSRTRAARRRAARRYAAAGGAQGSQSHAESPRQILLLCPPRANKQINNNSRSNNNAHQQYFGSQYNQTISPALH